MNKEINAKAIKFCFDNLNEDDIVILKRLFPAYKALPVLLTKFAEECIKEANDKVLKAYEDLFETRLHHVHTLAEVGILPPEFKKCSKS